MSSLTSHIKSIVLFSKKRKRLDDVDRQASIELQNQMLIVSGIESNQRVWGGNKNIELPRVRKNFEVDIYQSLGSTYFRRAYRMTKKSFDHLFCKLKPELKKEFHKSNGSRIERQKKSAYHIGLKIRLSAAIRYFAGGDPYDIMLSHGISLCLFKCVGGC